MTLAELVWYTLGLTGLSACLMFYFTKSSKKMPSNLHEFKVEMCWQYLGILAIVNDIHYRRGNRIDLYKQPDRVAVITGGNRGIGLGIIKKLLECEMTVVMGVRNTEEAKKNVEKACDMSKTKGKVIYETLDVGSMNSVKEFGKKVQSKFPQIDILFNNAGIMASPYRVTEDGYESQLAVNYLGHFLLTHMLLPNLRKAGKVGLNSRIVNVSSCIHHDGTINFDDIHSEKYHYPADAYSQSKLAQVLFTTHLDRMMQNEGSHVQVHSCHPGVVDTDLFEHSSTTYIPWIKKLLFKNTEQGARTPTYCGISPRLEGKGGTYINNCRITRAHSAAKDVEYCKKLFDLTNDMLKIKTYGNGQI